jgi:hypothetical protein
MNCFKDILDLESSIKNKTWVTHPEAYAINSLMLELASILKTEYLNKDEIFSGLLIGLSPADACQEIIKRAKSIYWDHSTTKVYFAYGSNMNVPQMAKRCPNAQVIAPASIGDHEFIINERGVASIRQKSGSIVSGLLWELTYKCEQSLDRYEGVSSGHYKKVFIEVGEFSEVLIYQASNQTEGVIARDGYLEGIIAAAKKLGMAEAVLANIERYMTKIEV